MDTVGFKIVVEGCFPTTITSVAFVIQGIINPNSERTSGSFIISSYDSTGTAIEVSSSGLFTI